MAIAKKAIAAHQSPAAGMHSGAATVQLQTARVIEALPQGRYLVGIAGSPEPAAAIEASVGVLLPVLVPGDEVLVAVQPRGQAAAITAVLAASPAMPWEQRAIRLQSQDTITLSCGEANLRLTAQGLARLVALTIEQDARDLLDIDAAEVRIN